MTDKTLCLLLLLTTAFLGDAQPDQVGEKVNDPPPPESRFVTVNGVKLHFLDWGGNGEVILLLAGLGNDAHIFDSFAPKLTGPFRVIALTRRGFGESGKPKSGYDTGTLVEDMRQFLNALNINEVSIIGHSMAGDEMTLFATLYPERVKKLVYLDAAADRSRTTELFPERPGPSCSVEATSPGSSG
jgi:pimeloyl-ACP methyl ester carboxylesterase